MRRTARWNVACDEGNTAKQCADDFERQGIAGSNAEQQTHQKPSKAERNNHSDAKTDECHLQSVVHNEAQNFPTART